MSNTVVGGRCEYVGAIRIDKLIDFAVLLEFVRIVSEFKAQYLEFGQLQVGKNVRKTSN